MDVILSQATAPRDQRGARPATTSSAAQRRLGRPGEWRRGVVDRLVDALRAELALWLIRETPAQLVGDLLGAPPLRQKLCDGVAQLGVAREPPLPRPCQARAGDPLRGMWQVAAALVDVASHLPADRRGAAAELGRDGPDRAAGPQQVRDRGSLVQ